jgi:hypothetical protein
MPLAGPRVFIPVENPATTRANSAKGTTAANAVPEHLSKDLFLVSAFRDGSTTPPTLPSGWRSITTAGANSCSIRLAYKIAISSAETVTGFTNATSLDLAIYRPGTGKILDIGAVATPSTGSSTTVTYPALTLRDQGGTSWVAGFGGHVSVDTTLETAPTGMKNFVDQLDATSEAAGHDTQGPVSSWASTNVSVGGTSGGWIGVTAEIREFDDATAITDAFNPNDKTNNTLSNSNKTTTSSGAGSVRCVQPRLYSAARVCQWTTTTIGFLNSQVGFCDAVTALSGTVAASNGAAVDSQGQILVNNSVVGGVGAGPVGGDVITGVFRNGKVWFKLNSGSWNNDGTASPDTNTNGITWAPAANVPVYPAAYGDGSGEVYVFSGAPSNSFSNIKTWDAGPATALTIDWGFVAELLTSVSADALLAPALTGAPVADQSLNPAILATAAIDGAVQAETLRALRAEVATPMEALTAERSDAAPSLALPADLIGQGTFLAERLASERLDVVAPIEGLANELSDALELVEALAGAMGQVLVSGAPGADLRTDSSAVAENLSSERRDSLAAAEILAAERSDAAGPAEALTGEQRDLSGSLSPGADLRADRAGPVEELAAERSDAVLPAEELRSLSGDASAPDAPGADLSADRPVAIEKLAAERSDSAQASESLASLRADITAPAELLVALRLDASARAEILAALQSDAKVPLEFQGTAQTTLNGDASVPLEIGGSIQADRPAALAPGSDLSVSPSLQLATSAQLGVDHRAGTEILAALVGDWTMRPASDLAVAGTLQASIAIAASAAGDAPAGLSTTADLRVDRGALLDWATSLIADRPGALELVRAIDAGIPLVFEIQGTAADERFRVTLTGVFAPAVTLPGTMIRSLDLQALADFRVTLTGVFAPTTTLDPEEP